MSTQVTTKTLNIVMFDELNDNVTWKINNPVTNGEDAVTRQKVADAVKNFCPTSDGGLAPLPLLYTNDGLYIRAFKEASIETITKTTEEL